MKLRNREVASKQESPKKNNFDFIGKVVKLKKTGNNNNLKNAVQNIDSIKETVQDVSAKSSVVASSTTDSLIIDGEKKKRACKTFT